EPMLRDLIANTLSELGYNVLEAKEPTEAVALLERHAAVDLVVTDVIMPQMNGPELVRQLLEMRPLLKVLYMSGYIGDAVLQHGSHVRAELLQKPFAPDILARKLREILDR